MDLSTVVIIVVFSLVSTGDTVPSQEPNKNTTTVSPKMTNTTPRVCSCTNATPAPTSNSRSFAFILGILTVQWTTKCEGTVKLVPYHISNRSSLPVCYSSENQVKEIMQNPCKNRKGCKDKLKQHRMGTSEEEGYTITDNGANKTPRCHTLQIKCTVEELPDFEGQLQACKVVIALLSIILLVLLLIRFTRPTVMALQKRLSDRRQHRWVGPTQSHSVSYHRGKNTVKNDDEEKRFSYPALERLTVGGSSPSFNRNHCNF